MALHPVCHTALGFPPDQRNGDKEFVIRRAATNRVLNVLRHWVSKHSQVGGRPGGSWGPAGTVAGTRWRLSGREGGARTWCPTSQTPGDQGHSPGQDPHVATSLQQGCKAQPSLPEPGPRVEPTQCRSLVSPKAFYLRVPRPTRALS